ncbi:uncharacterized protein LOC128026625 [Carassius gibelio]|uniref:uncharacterized protein LOC128026625 n=1 Tax=Carassius gibelio TaxID=101364 RepID=UPI0022795C90|nr:uncharacterized protein LOC128026625 [Carassius gibelio]
MSAAAVVRKKRYNVRDTSKFLKTVGGSKEHCCVPLCSASSRYNTHLSFHHFPKDTNLRAQWLHKIRRARFSVTTHTKVCSRHFHVKEIHTTAKGRRVLAVGSVPSLFEWNNYTTASRAGVWERRSRPPSPEPDPPGPDEDLEQPVMVPMVMDHDYGASRTIEAPTAKIVRVTRAKNTYATTTTIESLSTRPTKLLPIDEFFLFLTYLSTGCTQRELGHRFNIHRATVSRIIVTWANFLYSLLGSVCIWMSPAAVKASLPPDFNGSYSDTQVVLDCTELRCQTPSSLLLQSEVFSNYKSHCTFKAMVGMSPHGALTFVSALFEGSMSDREVFRQSGITSLLTPDMAIMVDKGFLVDDLVPGPVHRPAFLSKRAQMSEVDVLKTQSIARLRVHVERLIRRVKENKLFDTTIPLSIAGSINQIFTVACLLSNYQNGPLVKKWRL